MRYLPKLQQLKVFNEILKCGSIRSAAKKMNQSQPALTRSLKELEQILGATLMIRSNDGITLTEAGKSFSAYTRLILEELEQAANEVEQISRKVQTHVCFGISSVLAITVLAPIIRDFRKKYPTTRISVKEAQLSNLLPGLRDGSIDFAIGTLDKSIPGGDFNSEQIFEAPFGIIARKDHPLANATSLAELNEAKWLLPETDMGYYQKLRKHISIDNFTGEHVPVFSDSSVCIMNLVKNEDYLSVLTLARIAKDEFKDKFCVLPIKEQIPVGNYGLIHLRKRPLSSTAQNMLKEIKWHCQNYNWNVI